MDPMSVLTSQVWAMERKALESIYQRCVMGALPVEEHDSSRGKLYSMMGNVAVIPVRGVLTKTANWWNGGTAVVDVSRALALAAVDGEAKSIVLYIDSPGGSVDGISDLSDAVHSAVEEKPVVAFASGMMASAAYWVGCAASRIVASQDAIVGSIGVYTILQDVSKMMSTMGINHEIVRTGKYKGAEVPLFPISKESREQAQAMADSFHTLFVQKVADFRGMSPKQVSALADGRVYVGQAAVERGLADEIGTLDSVVAALATLQEDAKMAGIGKPKGTLIAGGLAAIGSVVTGRVQAEKDEKKQAEQDKVREDVNEEAEDEKKDVEAEEEEKDVEAEETECAPEDKKSKKAKAILANNITLANATAEDLASARPDLVQRLVSESNYADQKRRADIHTLIQSAKLPVKVAVQLEVSLASASLEKAKSHIDRACAIEAALELGRVSGMLVEADEDALRADVAGMRVHGALSYIRSFLEKKGTAKVTIVPVAAAAATQTVPTDAKRDELVGKLMAEYPKQKAVFPQLTKASFLCQGLSINGIQMVEADIVKAYPEQTKE